MANALNVGVRFCRDFGIQVALLLTAISVLPSLAWPQSSDHHIDAAHTSEPKANVHTKPLRADTNLVLVPATVVDALNRPVLDLEKDNFRVYEDDKQQNIRFFSQEDAPISVGMILDFSSA